MVLLRFDRVNKHKVCRVVASTNSRVGRGDCTRLARQVPLDAEPPRPGRLPLPPQPRVHCSQPAISPPPPRAPGATKCERLVSVARVCNSLPACLKSIGYQCPQSIFIKHVESGDLFSKFLFWKLFTPKSVTAAS